MPKPRLIVNADDFGYTVGVNRAIVELHQAGALSSTTLMATGAGFQDALARVRNTTAATSPPAQTSGSALQPAEPEALGIGCHVVLVDGIPAAAPEEIPSLLADAHSLQPHFRPSLGAFVTDLLRGRIRDIEIEREARAQIRALQSRGIHVTHIDTHKHTHMFPRVLRPLLRAALSCGVRAVRNPFEPAWSIEATLRSPVGAPLIRRAEIKLLTLLRPAFLKLVAEAGMRTTNGALGVLATGTLDTATLRSLLTALVNESETHPSSEHAAPVWELVCHPGYHDAALSSQHTRLQGAREIERVALLAELAHAEGFTLVHFGALGR